MKIIFLSLSLAAPEAAVARVLRLVHTCTAQSESAAMSTTPLDAWELRRASASANIVEGEGRCATLTALCVASSSARQLPFRRSMRAKSSKYYSDSPY